jgi:DNA-binding SARP family transcriptional activator
MSNGTLRSEISEKNSANFKIVPKKRTRIYLSGLMTVLDINGKNIAPNAKRTRAILAVLCFAKGRRVARGRLAGLLWDRSDESHAQTSVRQGLSDLNRAVGKRVPGLIEIDRHAARLNPDLCWIDIFDEGGHLDRLLEDLDGISSPFDRWLAAQRDQFEDNRREELEDRLNSLIAENAAPEMRSAAARELANFDRTHEGAARALMIAFAEMGNRAQSAREFARCRDELKRMDLVPSAETVAVYEAVRLVSIKSASNALHTNANPIEKIRSG